MPSPAPQRNASRHAHFGSFARHISLQAGKPAAFTLAVSLILIWAITGPGFHFSDTWQLVINTSTTIITFLMVFLIQNSQNRDSEALHIKLDELIHKLDSADNALLDLEELEGDELDEIRRRYVDAAHEARLAVKKKRTARSASPSHHP